MHLALYRCKKPIIAALEKFAINAGASLAFACDLIVAGETAFRQIVDFQQGASIPMNAAWLKIKTTEFQAERLAFLVDRILAPRLLQLGLISECVSENCVVERCNEIGATIAGYQAGAAIAIKPYLVAQHCIGRPEDSFPNIANHALNTAKMLKG
jgi:enoyl-CoA hydratase